MVVYPFFETQPNYSGSKISSIACLATLSHGFTSSFDAGC